MKDEETLLNVMKSVTKNAKSILLTFLFAIILVYIFAFVGFIFFRDDFIIEAEELSDVAVHKYQGMIYQFGIELNMSYKILIIELNLSDF